MSNIKDNSASEQNVGMKSVTFLMTTHQADKLLQLLKTDRFAGKGKSEALRYVIDQGMLTDAVKNLK